MYEKYRKFMDGRYGFDKLGGALIIAGLAVSVLGRMLWLVWLSRLSIVFYILFVIRFISRREYARSRENRIFINFWSNTKDFFTRDRITNTTPARCARPGSEFRKTAPAATRHGPCAPSAETSFKN